MRCNSHSFENFPVLRESLPRPEAHGMTKRELRGRVRVPRFRRDAQTRPLTRWSPQSGSCRGTSRQREREKMERNTKKQNALAAFTDEFAN